MVIACVMFGGLPAAQQGPAAIALAQAEARWKARKPKSYEFTIQVRCFCPDLLNVPPRFRVGNGDVRPLQRLEPSAQRVYAYYDTIEKLFAAIRQSMSRGQYKIAVEYHADLGYPLVADLDPSGDVIDDELLLRVIDFRPVDAGDALPNPR